MKRSKRAPPSSSAVTASNRVLYAWLAHADPRTVLLPDRPAMPDAERTYTPHNSGADLYPYLILTAELTDPALFHGRLLEMLRNEIRYTTVDDSVPGQPDVRDRRRRSTEPVRRRRIRQGRPHLGDRVPGAGSLVRTHGRHDRRCDAARGRVVALREPPGGRRRAQRRLSADARAACDDDRRSAVSRVGASHRGCLRRGGPARKQRRPIVQVGLHGACRRRPPSTPRSRKRNGLSV